MAPKAITAADFARDLDATMRHVRERGPVVVLDEAGRHITTLSVPREEKASREEALAAALAETRAALRTVLDALPKCTAWSLLDDDGQPEHDCKVVAFYQGVCDTSNGYACHGCRCKTCKPLPWADAAWQASALLGGAAKEGG